jgi:integrase
MKSAGLSEETLRSTKYVLRHLAQHTNIDNPEQVKQYISNLKIQASSKQKMINCYKYYAQIHSLKWTPPIYQWDRKIPLIPTTENIYKIISASSPKYATIFTILEETGLESKELETLRRNHIDEEHGIINAEGCKGHNSRSLRLTQKTTDLLRAYLHVNTGEHPFPRSKRMTENWITFRNRLATKLNEPQLKQIPLRNLRHHYATKTYDRTKDILLVMQKLGHKKIETTMLYTQLITFEESDEYTVRTATNVKEATDLLEHGFTYIQDIDGTKIYRKRK